MSAKHTPGPWKSCFNEQACHFNGVTRHGWTIDGPKMVPDYECDMFNESDARLIAAAPDLLDALQYLADEFRSVVNSEFATHRYHDPAKDDPAYLKAMAAIAKAIG